MHRKIILRNWQSPGDITMMTAVVRDLHEMYPGQYEIGVESPGAEMWAGNPFISRRISRFGGAARPATRDKEAQFIDIAGYPIIDREPCHFLHTMHRFVGEKLGIKLYPKKFKGSIHLTKADRDPFPDLPKRYWVIVAGGKPDFTIKHWTRERWVAVAEGLKKKGIELVQVGHQAHSDFHFDLPGVYDLRGKTTVRDLVRLVYHSEGVICPVTFLMHLAAAVPMKEGAPKNRPCVVVAGAREPANWEQYPQHHYLGGSGKLICCDNGGCWKSRITKLNDGKKHDNSLCENTDIDFEGSIIPECMKRITPEDVIEGVLSYSTVLEQARTIFHVCSYGGSGSFMLVHFLKKFGLTTHIHNRVLPEKVTRVNGQHFTNVPASDNFRHVVIYIYSRPEYAISRRWNYGDDANGKGHLKNIGVPDETIESLPKDLKEYLKAGKDLIGHEEFFDSYVNGKRDYKVLFINFHKIWDNKEKVITELGIPLEEGLRKFPVKREKVNPVPVEDPPMYRSLNAKINSLPDIFWK